MFPFQPRPRPGDRRFTQAEQRRQLDALARLADLDADFGGPPPDAPGPHPRFLARITERAALPPALSYRVVAYRWSFSEEAEDGRLRADLAGFRDTDGLTYPAYELSGNWHVPIGSVVEMHAASGGHFLWFSYPEGRVPARITGEGAPGVYSWIEQDANPSGVWVDVPGGRTGTITVNPAYERSGATGIAVNTLIWLERGYGEAADVVVESQQAGNGSTLRTIQRVYLEAATGGTWTLTATNAAGAAETTAPIAHNANAAAVEAALESLGNLTAVSVTGSGTFGSPFVVTFEDTFADLPLMRADPFGLLGTQEWSFDATGTTAVAHVKPTGPVDGGRYPGVLVEYDGTGWVDGDAVLVIPPNGEELGEGVRYIARRVAPVDGGPAYVTQQVAEATPDADGVGSGSGDGDVGVVGTFKEFLDIACEGGKLNVYTREVTLSRDADGALQLGRGVTCRKAVACCDDSCADDEVCDGAGSGSGPDSGSGGGDPPPPTHVESDCCPGYLVPARLWITFGTCTGDYSGLTGLSYPVDHDGGHWVYAIAAEDPVDAENIDVECTGSTAGNFDVEFAGGADLGSGVTDPESTCEPVTCEGTITKGTDPASTAPWTLTETPPP